MLFFFPPIFQILGGVALLAAGVADHKVVLDVAGAIVLLLGAARWLRRQHGSGVGR